MVERRAVRPFTTRVEYRDAAGERRVWSSRFQRKHASLLSRADDRGSKWWAPHRASWWIGVLFAIGSVCFMVGPFPGFIQLVGSAADGTVFFVGSVFFTSAALIQYLEAANADRDLSGKRSHRMRLLTFEPHRIDWWATTIQLAGTVFFNISTYDALSTNLSTAQENRLIWAPDVFGCACFLIASALAYGEVAGARAAGARRSTDWWIGVVNLGGSVAFAIAGVASYFVPDTGDILNLAAANFTTVIGALGFLTGALLMLVEGTRAGIPDPVVPAGA